MALDTQASRGKLEIAGVLEEESQGHKALKGLLDLLDMVVETGLKERLATQEHLVALADLDPPDVRESQVSLDVRERKAARTTHMVSVERKVTVEPLGQPDLRGRWENREGTDCQVSLEL